SLMAQRHPRRQKLVAAAADTGNRLDRVLTARVADLSRSRVKALILAGEVTVGGRTIRDPEDRVNAGDAIIIAIPEPKPALPAGEAIPPTLPYPDPTLTLTA